MGWERWYGLLDRAVDAALARPPGPPPWVVLFSGGVDSGLLAWELRNRVGTRLATFGLPGSPDLSAARRAAERIDLPWSPSTASPEEVRRRARDLLRWVGPLTPTERSIETAFALAVERAPRGTLVCGQGADELFFGYAHFRRLGAEEAARRAEADLAYSEAVAWPREREIGRRLGRTVWAPYLDAGFVRAACRIPVGDRSGNEPPKALFRAWAARRGLPEEIAQRPKKALQFGSGVDRLLRRGRADP